MKSSPSRAKLSLNRSRSTTAGTFTRLSLVLGMWVFAGTDPALLRAQDTAIVTVLHRFNGTDGSIPTAPLVIGDDGNFYGVTSMRGGNGNGTIFRVTPTGDFTDLHDFNGTDGSEPATGLTKGSDSNFYGSASRSTGGFGTVFQITPSGAFTTLHNFNGYDGFSPSTRLVESKDGNFYGVSGTGVIQISPQGDVKSIYALDANREGSQPSGELAIDDNGNLYGTTGIGGQFNQGTAYRVTPDGVSTILHSFAGGSDGSMCLSGLTRGRDGNFYGTTAAGGVNNSGLVFRLTPDGVFTILYSLHASGDGYAPASGVIEAKDGNFYGTTRGGLGGSVFQLTPDGVFTTLYSFNGGPRGSDPAGAQNGLVQGGDGSLYSTTTGGGGSGYGTVFSLSVIPHPAFFRGQSAVGNGVYYLAFPNTNYFGYYSYLADPNYLYHFDLGYEYLFDASDGKQGVYLYDFKSGGFFYTSIAFPFPYLYDFSLNSVVYYYPDPHEAGHYNTDGVRYFYVFNTGKTISK